MMRMKKDYLERYFFPPPTTSEEGLVAFQRPAYSNVVILCNFSVCSLSFTHSLSLSLSLSLFGKIPSGASFEIFEKKIENLGENL